MPDRLLANELARALDGEETRVPEAEQLATLLRSAAEVARFQVDAIETEQQLADARNRMASTQAARPQRRPFALTPRRALAAAAAAVAVAVAVLIALPETHPPGVDVEARALAAITEGPPVLQAVTQTTVPGTPGTVTRVEWLDTLNRRELVQVKTEDTLVSATLVQRGRVTQYQPQAGRAVVAPSCSALPGGCAAIIDPVAFYRDALAKQNTGAVRKTELAGRETYVFTLPVQALGGATNLIEQRAWVDATTFLPVRIVWSEAPQGGDRTPVAYIEVAGVRHLGTAESEGAFSLDIPAGTRVVQVASSGADVGTPRARTVTPARARVALPAARWLGHRYLGLRLRRVTVFRWPQRAGTAVRFDYGPLTLWSFDRVIPAQLLEGTIVPEKVIGDGAGVVRFYVARDGRLVAERDFPAVSVAAVGPSFRKLDLFAAVDNTRRLRPSPSA